MPIILYTLGAAQFLTLTPDTFSGGYERTRGARALCAYPLTQRVTIFAGAI